MELTLANLTQAFGGLSNPGGSHLGLNASTYRAIVTCDGQLPIGKSETLPALEPNAVAGRPHEPSRISQANCSILCRNPDLQNIAVHTALTQMYLDLVA